MQIQPSLIPFLKDLAENNNRPWFEANRKRYEAEKSAFQQVIAYLIEEIGIFENLNGLEVKHCSYRINRDIRFSANKAPYKNNFAASFEEGGKKAGRAGYYLHIQPGNSFLGGGAWDSTPENIAKVRQEIDYNPEKLLKIINNITFKKYFGEIQGSGLKTAPKGYAKDHENIELIRKNQWFVMHKFTNNEVIEAGFLQNVVNICKTMKPFTDWVNIIYFE